jgi:Fe-S cluster assembly ATP-binding protein
MASLKIENLSVTAEDQQILKGLNLEIHQGKVHAIMGPNGTGKTTLAYTLMGHPRYTITSGSVALNGTDLLSLPPEERSKHGVFLAFQYPVAIPGVTVANFLRTAINAHRKSKEPGDKGIPILDFRNLLTEKMKLLKMDPSMAGRYLNDVLVERRKELRFCKWQCLSPESPFLTKLILA